MKNRSTRRRRKRKPPILTDKTQKLIISLQERLGLPLVVYWVSTGGSICQNDVTAMSKLLGPSKRQPRVGLFLKSDGGNPEAALRLVHLLRQMCLALREAHGIALLHRDLKPSNIIACQRGGFHDVVKLLDFGLVQDLGLGEESM